MKIKKNTILKSRCHIKACCLIEMKTKKQVCLNKVYHLKNKNTKIQLLKFVILKIKLQKFNRDISVFNV